MEGAGGAEKTHDRPGAPLLKSIHPDARRGAIVGGFCQPVVPGETGGAKYGVHHPTRRARPGRLERRGCAGTGHSGRVARRVGSRLRPWFDAVWPEAGGQASKALFMSNVGPGTRFHARPRVWPGLLSAVTSTDEPCGEAMTNRGMRGA